MEKEKKKQKKKQKKNKNKNRREERGREQETQKTNEPFPTRRPGWPPENGGAYCLVAGSARRGCSRAVGEGGREEG